ncbi:TetR/AcrR family transcriptional regulator [Mycobacterium seoulense]|uniref:TetR/AcrR family transcriptional regulator n=1 Tax=Mycobacterium seoulense TaxID=386911 RepID=UPI003CF5F75E
MDRSPLPPGENRELAWQPGRRSERTRRKLIDAAKQVFLDRGFHGARAEDIAAAAGMSRGTFYIYFPSKNDIFLALGRDSARGGYSLLNALKNVPTEWSPTDLAELSEKLVDYYDEFGAFIRLWRQVSMADVELRQEGARFELRMERRLGIELDRLRGRSPTDPASSGVAFLAIAEGLWFRSRWLGNNGANSRDRLVETIRILVTELIN